MTTLAILRLLCVWHLSSRRFSSTQYASSRAANLYLPGVLPGALPRAPRACLLNRPLNLPTPLPSVVGEGGGGERNLVY